MKNKEHMHIMKIVRDYAGMNLHDFSKTFGKTQVCLSYIENYKRPLSLADLLKLLAFTKLKRVIITRDQIIEGALRDERIFQKKHAQEKLKQKKIKLI
jgi:hypothetical protein